LGYVEASDRKGLSLSKYQIRPEAERDLDTHGLYLASTGRQELALRFIDSTRKSFAALGDNPHMGGKVQSQNLAFASLRKWHVAGFGNYLIFHLPLENGADILRILHGVSDWWASLDIAS
jgi:plasmid stabilization system protein ParE